MNTSTQAQPNGEAPAVQAYSFGPRMAKAWQDLWNRLDRVKFIEAIELAEAVAEQHDLKPSSLISHLHRMASEGHLAHEVRSVQVPVTRQGSSFTAKRNRTFYKIASQ
jgi:hypothetical protein